MDYEVIAERTLTSTSDSDVTVTVSLARPTFNEGRRDYECVYQIVGAGRDIKRFAAGIDEFQALWLCFGMIGADISFIERTIGHSLRFEGGDGWFLAP